LRSSMPKKKTAGIPSKLTVGEQDLLSHLEHGYQLETDSLGGGPVLRRLQDDELIRPPSANASSVKSLQQRGLIYADKGQDPLTIVWRLGKKQRRVDAKSSG
jgi:hypothetical protein